MVLSPVMIRVPAGQRTQAATLASQIPNVKEVINEMQIKNKNQKATGGRGR